MDFKTPKGREEIIQCLSTCSQSTGKKGRFWEIFTKNLKVANDRLWEMGTDSIRDDSVTRWMVILFNQWIMLVEWFGGQVNELSAEHVKFRCLAWTRATDVTSSVFAGNWSLQSRLDCPERAGEWAKQWAECVSLEIYHVRHPPACPVLKWLIIFRQPVRLHLSILLVSALCSVLLISFRVLILSVNRLAIPDLPVSNGFSLAHTTVSTS